MFVTLKLATSLDGRIATASGESRWITGPEAREAVHRLRAQHDAVLIGIETALADDPELTVRLPEHHGAQPARIVLDSRQRLLPTSRLAQGARTIPTFIMATTSPNPELTALGVRVLEVSAGEGGHPTPDEVLARLADEGLDRLFVEGGGQVAASFLRAGLVDALEWFRAPLVLGSEGRAGIGAMKINALSEAPRLKRVDVRQVGSDLWERYERI